MCTEEHTEILYIELMLCSVDATLRERETKKKRDNKRWGVANELWIYSFTSYFVWWSYNSCAQMNESRKKEDHTHISHHIENWMCSFYLYLLLTVSCFRSLIVRISMWLLFSLFVHKLFEMATTHPKSHFKNDTRRYVLDQTSPSFFHLSLSCHIARVLCEMYRIVSVVLFLSDYGTEGMKSECH